MSASKNDDALPDMLPWLLSRFEPFAVRSQAWASFDQTQRAEERLRRYIEEVSTPPSARSKAF